jgi:hypothetical protein
MNNFTKINLADIKNLFWKPQNRFLVIIGTKRNQYTINSYTTTFTVNWPDDLIESFKGAWPTEEPGMVYEDLASQYLDWEVYGELTDEEKLEIILRNK